MPCVPSLCLSLVMKLQKQQKGMLNCNLTVHLTVVTKYQISYLGPINLHKNGSVPTYCIITESFVRSLTVSDSVLALVF